MVRSFYPIYTKDTLIQNHKIIGKWECQNNDEIWEITLPDTLESGYLADVKVHYQEQYIIANETFQNILLQSNEDNLMRIHKSFAVSLNKFDHVDGNMIKIKNTTIPIGQTYRTDFLEHIKTK